MFTSKVILFQEALLFRKAIVLCYSSQTIVHVSNRIPPTITWHICQTIVDCLSPIVITCVLKQSKDHWLLSICRHANQ
jgi:hypothetical protein